jgi:hypothetical protein
MKEIQEAKGQAVAATQNTNEQLLDTLMKNIMMQEITTTGVRVE